MKIKALVLNSLWLALLLSLSSPVHAQAVDPGWPRVFKKDGKQLTIYQPQVDYWHGYTNLHFRTAIAVKGVSKQEKFGVAEVDALTITDHGARIVAIVPLKRELRFVNTPEPELTKLRQAAEQLSPPGKVTTLSLDRVIAYLDPAKQPVQPSVGLNLDPPKIFSSPAPAILVIYMGEPQFKPVETNRTDLLFALNTNWDVLYDAASKQYFLLNGEGWLTATDVLKGPWVPAQTLPPSIYSLPANENWAEARTRLPGKPAKLAPAVFTTTEPAEMILTDGPPSYRQVRGTRLLQVNNTASVLFLHTGDGKLYFLVAGRWFRGGSVNGPWSAASNDLPSDFAQIPGDDPAAFVKAAVAGTREAQDAVLLASIPTTTTVHLTNVTVNVTYGGAPQFVVIPSTTVQYAVNTPNQVFLVNGGYYCCSQGVWFWRERERTLDLLRQCSAGDLHHPSLESELQRHLRGCAKFDPHHGDLQPDVGYSGEYVAANGVLMFGMGMLVGAAIANNNDYYYPPYPCHYSYGCGATYHYGHGGYYGTGGAVYGPYGGAGYSTGYNPSTGTYGRSSYAYGPYGSASRSAAYNPYTGTSAAGRSVSTAYGSASQGAAYNSSTGARAAGSSVSTDYGSASRGAAYNPTTGTRAAGGSVSTDYGSAGRGAAYNPTTGQGAAGKYASGEYGSAGAVKTTGGGGAAAWDTQQGQGAVGKTASGDVYASNGDTVYKKDSDGSWSQNSGTGWESTESPQQKAQSQASSKQQQYQSQAQTQSSSAQSQAQTRASSGQSQASSSQAQRSASGTTPSASSTSSSQNKQSMESQAQARQSGNQQAARSSQYQSSGSSSSGGRSSSASRSSSGSRSGGGRR